MYENVQNVIETAEKHLTFLKKTCSDFLSNKKHRSSKTFSPAYDREYCETTTTTSRASTIDPPRYTHYSSSNLVSKESKEQDQTSSCNTNNIEPQETQLSDKQTNTVKSILKEQCKKLGIIPVPAFDTTESTSSPNKQYLYTSECFTIKNHLDVSKSGVNSAIDTPTTTTEEILSLCKLTKLHTAVWCKLPKLEFEEVLQLLPQHLCLIQHVDSRRRTSKEGKIDFYLTNKSDLYLSPDHCPSHIYFNQNKFFDDDANTWSIDGLLTKKFFKTIPHKGPKKNVDFKEETYKNKIMISATTLLKHDFSTLLPKLIKEFEGEKPEIHRGRDKNVFLNIMGTPSTGRNTLQKLLNKLDDTSILKKRIVYSKNLTQYQDKLDSLGITHILEDKFAYVKKAYVSAKIYRRALFFPQIKNVYKKYDDDPNIKRVNSWTEIFENIGTSKSRKNFVIENLEQTLDSIGNTCKGGNKKFITWNMNSLRNVDLQNHLVDFLLTCNADFIGITELDQRRHPKHPTTQTRS